MRAEQRDPGLGYDPRPEVMEWRGTPIPRVSAPLPARSELVRIARRIWWNGDPWTILRNRGEFLRQAMDYATRVEFDYLWETIPEEDWIAAVKAARPGQVSARSWKFCMWRLGLLGEGNRVPPEWHGSLHVRDKIADGRAPIFMRGRGRSRHAHEHGR